MVCELPGLALFTPQHNSPEVYPNCTNSYQHVIFVFLCLTDFVYITVLR